MLISLLLTFFFACMIVVYCWILLKFALTWWNVGKILGKLMAVGIVIIPILGIWIIVRTLYSGYNIQKLSQRARAIDMDLDDAQLGRRPSGRIILAEADALFLKIKSEWEADPDTWISNYRLAKAYDYAGDRTRARKIMQRALQLEKSTRHISTPN